MGQLNSFAFCTKYVACLLCKPDSQRTTISLLDVQKIAEETKVQVRNVRRDTIEKLKAMKKAGELTEDDLKHGEKKTQDLTDKMTKKIDKISADKQKEVLEL